MLHQRRPDQPFAPIVIAFSGIRLSQVIRPASASSEREDPPLKALLIDLEQLLDREFEIAGRCYQSFRLHLPTTRPVRK